jgi:type I restriction enzyme S subunit
MTLELRPYPEYKDSGLPWLGEIPAHWRIGRTKQNFRLSIEKSNPNHGMELLSIYTHIGVRPRNDLEQRGNKATTTDGYWVVKKGDIIVNKLLAWMGAVGVSHYDGVTSPAYDILRPVRELAPDFYHHLFRTSTYLQQFKSRSRGIMEMRLRLYFDQFGQIPLLIPPLDEQRAIVSFLEEYSRLVNRFIRIKRRAIELLNEQKQAIINRAVTRGLDPGVRVKASGIDWLGDVPEHWEIRPLKQVASVRLSGVDKHTLAGEIPVRLCNYTDVYKRDFITADIEFMKASAKPPEVAAFTLRAGDVLITKDSEEWDDIAVPALVRQNLDGVLCGYHLAVVRPDFQCLDSEYLFRAFLAPSLARQFHVLANGVTRYGLSKNAIKDSIFLVPPVQEQRDICEWITDELRPIAASMDRIQREIDLIHEYRTRLITDVVTGKIDVRHVRPQAVEPSPADLELLDNSEVIDEQVPEAEDLEAVEEVAE